MNYITIAASVLSCLLTIILLVIVFKNKNSNTLLNDNDIKKIKDSINDSINLLGNSISNLVAEKNDFLMRSLLNKIDSLNNRIEDLMESQVDLNDKEKMFENKLLEVSNSNHNDIVKLFNDFSNKYFEDNKRQQEEIINKLSEEIKEFNNVVKNTLDDFNSSMKEQLNIFKINTKENLNSLDHTLVRELGEFKVNTNENLDSLNQTVTRQLDEIRADNNEKLDKINSSVNEKLQKTLEDNLKNSFKGVVEGLSGVNTAIGEIKGLASDVGSLKNVLTNVKTKGIMGEVILGNLIREFLTCGQYKENIATKVGSSDRVEFAIVLPGTKDNNIYLPVDSKFPYEPYSKLQESTDTKEVEEARKLLRSNLLKYAKDVHDKYIDVPNTTEFAVIFLPLEGLYLEALNMGLLEELQNKYKITLTGPTTFTAFINSLNMGFRSLLIQKKSADVFNLLGAVKTEFGKFAEALEKTQKKVNAASEELDTLVGTRTRVLTKKLKDVESLDEETTKLLLGENSLKAVE